MEGRNSGSSVHMSSTTPVGLADFVLGLSKLVSGLPTSTAFGCSGGLLFQGVPSRISRESM